MSFSDVNFENIQLMKLVNSAETIFQRLYGHIDDEQKLFIDQWLCLKQEYDSVCNNSTLDSCENLDESSMLSPIDEVSENESCSITSSVSSRPMKAALKNVLQTHQDQYTTFSNKSHRLPRSARKTDLDHNVDEYMTELKIYTDVLSSLWISNLSFSLIASEEDNIVIDNNYGIIANNEKTTVAASDTNELLNQRDQRIKCCVATFDLGEQKTCNQIQKKIITYKTGECCNKTNSHLKCEIKHLQELRLPLLQMRRNIMDSSKCSNEPLETSPKFKDYLKFEVIIETMDISIEMKNQLRLGRNVLDVFEIIDPADVAMADCFSMLSLDEVKCLLITFLKKVIDIREGSSKLDKEILKQDNFVFYQKFIIRNLNKTINSNKLLYESQCLNMKKEYEKKLESMRRSVAAGWTRGGVGGGIAHGDNSSTSNPLDIMRYRPEVIASRSQNDFDKDKIDPLIVIDKTVNFKTGIVRSRHSPSNVTVTRQNNKIIIQQEKNGPPH